MWPDPNVNTVRVRKENDTTHCYAIKCQHCKFTISLHNNVIKLLKLDQRGQSTPLLMMQDWILFRINKHLTSGICWKEKWLFNGCSWLQTYEMLRIFIPILSLIKKKKDLSATYILLHNLLRKNKFNQEQVWEVVSIQVWQTSHLFQVSSFQSWKCDTFSISSINPLLLNWH